MNAEKTSNRFEPQEEVPKGELISLEIDRAKKAGMNMLLPSTHIEGISEFHTPVIDYIQLDPNPESGDVYYHSESGKMALAKQGLMKIAGCAGIIWDVAETRRTDNRRERDYVSYQAVGGLRRADGSLFPFKSEYDMDFEVIEEKLRGQYEKKGKKSKKAGDELQDYVSYCVKRDLLYKREHKLKICESGAITRVIRSLLGLRAGYTKQELQKPFVVARIVFRPDYSDPQIRDMMIKKGVDSLTSIYGGGDEQPEPLSTDAAKREILDTCNEAGITTRGQGDSAPENDKESDSNITNQKADFLASDKSTRIDILKKMAKRGGYNLQRLQKPLSQFTDEQQEGFFDHLFALQKDDQDDIPY